MTHLRLHETPKLGVHQTGSSSIKYNELPIKLLTRFHRKALVQFADRASLSELGIDRWQPYAPALGTTAGSLNLTQEVQGEGCLNLQNGGRRDTTKTCQAKPYPACQHSINLVVAALTSLSGSYFSGRT
jgi:hypothetical protein